MIPQIWCHLLMPATGALEEEKWTPFCTIHLFCRVVLHLFPAFQNASNKMFPTYWYRKVLLFLCCSTSRTEDLPPDSWRMPSSLVNSVTL